MSPPNVCSLRFVFVCLVGSLVLASPAVSQTTWDLGFKGGVNLAKLRGDDTGRFGFADPDIVATGSMDNTRTGFTIGGFAYAHFTEVFGLRLEPSYVSKGGKGDFNGTVFDPDLGPVPFTGEITMTLDYFEIPVLAVLTNGTFELFAGPSIGFSTKSEIELSLTALGTTVTESQDAEGIKSTDLGGVIGAGVTIPAGTVNVVLDGRFSFGFTSIDDSPEAADVKNSGFSFQAGLGFPLSSSGG